MGHQVIQCDDCGSLVMESRNDWKCDCGWVWPPKPKFNRENRYVIFKISDMNQYLSQEQIDYVNYLGSLIFNGRKKDLKDNHISVVIEDDWSCYEKAWKLVEQEANITTNRGAWND